MTTYRPVYITKHALTTGVIVAHVGGLARISRYYNGKRYKVEDYHTTIEGAFRRVREMIADERRANYCFIREGPDESRLDTIEAILDRGELPWAAETEPAKETMTR